MDIIEKTVEATIDNLHDVLGFLEEELEKHEASMKAINIISVALEEMYANIAMYAYEGKEGKATITLGFENNDVVITLIDSGMPFNPLEKIDPNIHGNVEDRQIGGLGIFMVKKTMDECSYEYSDSKNIFTMRKAIK